jgi:hypothetical protein
MITKKPAAKKNKKKGLPVKEYRRCAILSTCPG